MASENLPGDVFTNHTVNILQEMNGIEGAALVTALLEFIGDEEEIGDVSPKIILQVIGGINTMLSNALIPQLDEEAVTKVIRSARTILDFANEAAAIVEDEEDN